MDRARRREGSPSPEERFLDHVVGVARRAGDALSEVEKEAAIAVGDLLEGIGVLRPQAFHEASIVRRYRAAHPGLLGRARS
jgi:hypothetical protein